MPWLTPDTAPTLTQCRRLLIPDDELWLAAVSGALVEMTREWNWEEHGALTPEEAAERAQTMFLAFLDDSGCAMSRIGEVFASMAATPPAGCLYCDGTTYLGSAYPALWAIIQANWKTDATHFKVPDLQSRIILGSGHGAGLEGYSIAAKAGEEYHTLITDEMPAHTHDLPSRTTVGSQLNRVVTGTTSTTVNSTAIQSAGGGLKHENRQPYQVISYYVVVSE